MSSGRKPRQILGVNSLKLECEIPHISVVADENEKLNSEQLVLKSVCDEKCISINDENKNFRNKSKDPVVMNFENVNRIFCEGMSSFWPYQPVISPLYVQPTLGLIPPAPGFYHQVPYYAFNPTQFAGQMQEPSSSLPNFNTVSLQNDNTSFVNSGENLVLNEKQFRDLTLLAMRGSETAEKIAYTHRNRPCFKKIDSLCARMKQDLIRPDGVLPNINSQGIAWAVKDFIFVFTRIINAWIIIRGYIYNTPQELNKIKAEFSSDFPRSFVLWQDATINFVENLIKSFVNLDKLVQNQSVSKKGETTPKCGNSTTAIKILNQNLNSDLNENLEESFDIVHTDNNGQTLNKSYYSTLIEDSEESQRKANADGTYIKTGVYTPLREESVDEIDSQIVSKANDETLTNETIPSISNFEKMLPINFQTMNSTVNSWMTHESAWPNQTPVASVLYTSKEDTSFACKNSSNIKLNKSYNYLDVGEDGALFDSIKSIFNEQISNNSNDLKQLQKNIYKYSEPINLISTKIADNNTMKKLEILLKKIQNLPEGNLFFEERFMKNYFPDFMSKCPKFLDLRSIILKAQIGDYVDINDFIQDLKLITTCANSYLKVTCNEILETAINKYDTALKKILRDELLIDCDIDQ